MRIIIIGINFYPEPTGIGKYTGEMALYLMQSGFEVSVITAYPYYPQWKIAPGYQGWRYTTEEWQGIKIIRCPIWIPGKVSSINRLLHLISFSAAVLPVIIKEAITKFNLIISVAPSILSAPVALLLNSKNKCKTWLHVQDFELDAALALGMISNTQALKKAAFWGEEKLLNKFDAISTISNTMLNKLKEKKIQENKLYYFPNWVDPKIIFPLHKDSHFRKDLRINKEDIIALYSGSLGKKQGIEIIIEAGRLLTKHRSIHFVICGEGPGKIELEKSAEGLENLHFLPIQSTEALNELLGMADIHLLPQKAEAADLVMPSKLLGMLASGKPIISGCPVGSELFKLVSEIGIVIPPGDPIALAKEIVKLSEDEDTCKILGEKGRSFVIHHYSKEIVLSQFVNHILELIG